MAERRGRERKAAILTLACIFALVVGFVILTNRPQWEMRTIVSVDGRIDSSALEVTVAHGRCSNGVPVVRVDDETDERIVIRAEHDVRGDCDDAELFTTLPVDVEQPVGDRVVAVLPASDTLECSIAGRPNGACAP